MLQAAADGDAAKVQELIDDGADVDKDGVGSRSHAAGHDHIGEARLQGLDHCTASPHVVMITRFPSGLSRQQRMNCAEVLAARPAHQACTE